MKIPFGMLIVPGTKLTPAKPSPGDIFAGEYDDGIDQTAEYEVTVAYHTADRGKEGGESVYRKHPDRGSAGETVIPLAKRMERRKGNLQKPSQQPAVYEIVD